MKSHRPGDYSNPFERIACGVEDDFTLTKQSDVFYRDELITAFIAIGRPPNIPFSTLIIPNEAYENLYGLPDDSLTAISLFSKRLAIALVELYDFDGVTIRQHNGQSQDVWHYHLHVMPRLEGDLFHAEAWRWLKTTAAERQPYAASLRSYFAAESQ